MHPAPFEYVRPASLAEALRLLAEQGDEAKVMAGGQSLMPMLNLRLARPACVVDISCLPELRQVRQEGDTLQIGALVRHQEIHASPAIRAAAPLLSEAAGLIGNIRVRHRGTIGGSLAHADPAAELGGCALALRAEIEATGNAGSRRIPADEFFVMIMTTALEPGELITGVRIPAAPPRTGASFQEMVRRAGDFAIVGVGAQVSLAADNATVAAVGIGLIGVGYTPLRAAAAEAALLGRAATAESLAAAAALAVEGIDPQDDPMASAEYRRLIVPVMVRRALTTAVARAQSAEGR